MESNYDGKLKLNIYFVRHGETEFNKSGVIQGQLDTKLSQNGMNQAFNVGKYFQKNKFDYVFSSDLERAHQTAIEIVKNNVNKSSLKIITDQLLRERHFGEAQGKNKAWIIEQAKSKNKSLSEYVPTGGENCAQVLQRWKIFFEKIFNNILKETINSLTEKNLEKAKTNDVHTFDILLVTHGALMREIFKYLIFDLNCHFFHDYDELNKPIGNTSISHFSFEYKLKKYSTSQEPVFDKKFEQLSIKCNYLYRNEHLNVKNETLCDL